MIASSILINFNRGVIVKPDLYEAISLQLAEETIHLDT